MENGFQLLIGLAEIHVPRMWVERHTNKPDSQVSGNIISRGQQMRECPADESYKDKTAEKGRLHRRLAKSLSAEYPQYMYDSCLWFDGHFTVWKKCTPTDL